MTGSFFVILRSFRRISLIKSQYGVKYEILRCAQNDKRRFRMTGWVQNNNEGNNKNDTEIILTVRFQLQEQWSSPE